MSQILNPLSGRMISVDGPTYKRLLREGVHVGSGSRSRGWADIAPRSKSEREALLKKCGKKCFLEPEALKFPVCDKDCKVDYRGIQAAKIRASQWKHKNALKEVSKFEKKKQC